MGSRGVYFALEDDDAQKLLTAKSDSDVMAALEEIEERWDEAWLQETDKSWDAIHRCLTDGTLNSKGKSNLEKCVLGGRQLHKGSNHIVSFVAPEEVRELVNALDPITEDGLRQKFFGLRKKFLFFDVTDYEGALDEQDFEYTWAYFVEVRDFFRKAAKSDRAVIFTVRG